MLACLTVCDGLWLHACAPLSGTRTQLHRPACLVAIILWHVQLDLYKVCRMVVKFEINGVLLLQVKIGDFGFAKQLASAKGSMRVKRVTHPRWVAPEVRTIC